MGPKCDSRVLTAFGCGYLKELWQRRHSLSSSLNAREIDDSRFDPLYAAKNIR